MKTNATNLHGSLVPLYPSCMIEESIKIPILLVDDREENRLALRAVLDSPNYELVEASGGLEAYGLVETREFAVILLDVQMPDLDGFETAYLIRNHPKAKTTPIIFITAELDSMDRLYKGYEAGAVDYIFKPFEPLIIRSKIKVFVELYKSKKENLRQSELLRVQEIQGRDLFLEYALDAVVAMNEKGLISYWNLQAEIIFGWKKEEVIGCRMSEFIIPERYRSGHESGLKKFLQTGEGPILRKRIEINALRKDGTEFPVELAVLPIMVGAQFTFSAFVRDISDRKERELERKNEREELRKAIQARDEFIGICSHELKTPLTSMKLQFQLAAKQFDKDDPKVFTREAIQRRIANSNTQLDRMTRLIDDMLDVSRISSGKLVMKKEMIDVSELAHEVLERFQDQLNILNIPLTFDDGHLPLMIYGDKFRIEQVITNLITNAIKYGDGSAIQVTLRKQGYFLYFSVEDHGLGIDEENLERIFYRYERAIPASNISGLGLGLYITRQIVEAHGGTIQVMSELGKGSIFSVELPLTESHLEAPRSM